MAELSAAQSALSLHLSGHISLGSLPLQGRRNMTLLPFIGRGMRITLWSEEGATLDAEGRGRLLFVMHGGELLLQGLTLTNGRTHGGTATGGCVQVRDPESTLIVRDSRFTNCSTEGLGGGAVGSRGGTLVMARSTIENCSVVDPRGGGARGGGVSVTLLSETTLINTSFIGTRAESAAGGAFGGGLALFGGGWVTLHGCTFEATSAAAFATADAFVDWQRLVAVIRASRRSDKCRQCGALQH